MSRPFCSSAAAMSLTYFPLQSDSICDLLRLITALLCDFENPKCKVHTRFILVINAKQVFVLKVFKFSQPKMDFALLSTFHGAIL